MGISGKDWVDLIALAAVAVMLVVMVWEIRSYLRQRRDEQRERFPRLR